MRRLLIYLKGYYREAVLAPLFKMLEASFELAVPLVMANIIDVGIGNQDESYIWKMCAVMILLGVVGLLCSVTAQYFSARAAMGFSTALRHSLFSHIQTFSYRELDLLGTPTLITRITNDVNQAQTGVNLVLRLFLRSPFIVVGAVIMAFTIDVKIALIFVIAVPLISLVIYLIMRLTVPIYKKVQSYLDRISRITRENHVGARVVRAFCRQKEESSDFMQTNDLYTKIQIAAGKISALLNPATYVIMNLAIVAILWSGSAQVDAGRITQGEVVALVNYMTQILVALLALANLIVAVTKATASGARLNEIFDTQTTLIEKESQEQHPKASENRVVFEKVTFTYAGAGAPALEDISFVAKSGETIGIIGGTGSGKTTLIHLIPRFYDIQKGEILVDKIPVDRYPFWQLREKVGMVPQHAVLFKGTVRENMRWGKSDATDEEIWEALKIAQAKEFVENRPGGLDSQISQGGANLSGGQRQRLTIARALVGQPEILIMDDSASALDFATDAALRQAIKEKTKGMTVFLVSQRAASIRQADRILVLDDGRLVGSGTHLELLENCPVYEEICLSQLSEQEVRRV
ncbi:Probable multidrug resistance ABC transporter ATP-binding/permease protein YheI [Blautia hydrogenotrophica]|uniref:ABC transporter ATP-binding protein n=1 Tax=Blautia hydrogenotrophica TaxID=53443 RepID=UPI0006C2D605|nr:ABC transporter ATP-binding protein [Blautia hydrogenotrophica]CUN16243.1 Probable multidrug resistance ABC transporter ATP-binding/permease protein YheI [Blautia hydrogenotrophica]SCI25275.1 Probable multidrug resistance ABC transporter ATP-binding/permease protein YheI [uncultured Blautia sp.]